MHGSQCWLLDEVDWFKEYLIQIKCELNDRKMASHIVSDALCIVRQQFSFFDSSLRISCGVVVIIKELCCCRQKTNLGTLRGSSHGYFAQKAP